MYCICNTLRMLVLVWYCFTFSFFFNSKHVTGEEWMINQPGAYLPDVYEEVRNNKCSIEHLPTFSRKIWFSDMFTYYAAFLSIVLAIVCKCFSTREIKMQLSVNL